MSRWTWVLVGAVLGFASSGAVAFQESKEGSPATPVVPGKDLSVPGTVPLNTEGTGTSIDRGTGTEIRIPGLGRLGVLPKFDFGLELLYGVDQQKGPVPEAERRPDGSDDLQIRGSLKHRF